MKILEIAIGLSFVYILFSLICTTLTEAIARVASLRARTLKGAIRHMIDDGTTVNVDVLYESPFIRNLSKKSWLIRQARPSYISSRTFALALYDTLLEAKPHLPRAVEVAEDDSPADIQAKVDAYIESLQRDQQQRVENEVLVQQDAEARNQLKQLITSTIPADHPERDKWLNLLAPVTAESLALQNKARDRFLELRSAVSKMEPPDSQFQKGLLRILDNAEMEAKDYDTALANARLGMEVWFDDTMSRVTGWYARNTRTIVVILALFIT